MEFSEVIEVLDRGSSIDVQSNCTFESLMIGQKTLERLKNSQFDRPSPVQARAIPVGLLGRGQPIYKGLGLKNCYFFRYACSGQVRNRKNARFLGFSRRKPGFSIFTHPKSHCDSDERDFCSN